MSTPRLLRRTRQGPTQELARITHEHFDLGVAASLIARVDKSQQTITLYHPDEVIGKITQGQMTGAASGGATTGNVAKRTGDRLPRGGHHVIGQEERSDHEERQRPL